MLGDIRNLGPKDESITVRELIDIGVMLIMGQTNRVCPHLQDEREILFVHRLADGASYSLSVLMHGDPDEGVFPSIKNKTTARIHMAFPHTKASGNLILTYLGVQFIKVRVVFPVPKMDVVDE